MASFDDLTSRVERLLLRFEELQRTNELLEDKLRSATAERDSLRSRLTDARSRVDALLSKLPVDVPLAPVVSSELREAL